MAKIKIVYTAVTAPSADLSAPICRLFMPTNAAADLAAFDGTYYDTNVAGMGEGMSIEAFFTNSIAHPGLVLALKTAMASGSYEYTEADEKEIAYVQEVSKAVADQGFTITVVSEDEK